MNKKNYYFEKSLLVEWRLGVGPAITRATLVGIDEISFELQMETILMLMMFTVLLCYLSTSEERPEKLKPEQT